MPIEVIMPKVDMDMSSGRIVIWHALPGDKVEKGAPLFDIETDKAAMEVEAPASGILRHPVDQGVDVPIGKPVAWLYGEDETVGEMPASGDIEPSEKPTENEPAPEPAALPETFSGCSADEPRPDKIRATPLARKLAGEAGIDLRAMSGSGKHGRVQADDVREALDARLKPVSVQQIADETGPLSITRSGGGTATPIILLHGFASDATSWAPLEAHLGDSPIIRLDLLCHGRSPKRRIAGFTALLSEVRKAFDRLNLEKAHLIGHSLGGALALALADTRERSIQSLTLIAPAGLGPDINGKTLDGINRATRPESLGPWLKTLVAEDALITEGYARAAMSARHDPVLRAAQQALSDALFPDGVQAFDLRPALHRLAVPTRIIWGKQDEIIPWHHALRAPGRVALHLFESLGHLPQIEGPEDVGKVIRTYL